jgi:ATP phosphoribosyltransferase
VTDLSVENFNVAGAERIAIAKGDDRRPCIEAFEAVTGIEVPDFDGRQLTAMSEGREFFLLKGRDIPGFVDAGLVDIGTTGTDSSEEYTNMDSIRYLAIGEPMCRFVLLSEAENRQAIDDRLRLGRLGSDVLKVATSKPDELDKIANEDKLPIEAVRLPAGMTISGSLEIMPHLMQDMGVKLVADLVASGETAQQNGLAEVRTFSSVYPALVQKA